MKIGIVVGSIRDARKGASVGAWVHESAQSREDVTFEVVDLKDYDLPLFASATLPMMAGKQYGDDRVTRWSQAIDACDAFVFVTPEYNHGVPGAFKNAVDSLGSEWVGKPVGFVSYGAEGGVRAVEHWRTVLANFSMVDVRGQVALSVFADFDADQVTPTQRRAGELTSLLDQLVEITGKLRG